MLAGESMEVGVVASIAAKWMVFIAKADHLPVQSEHLLNEGAAEVEQRHLEAWEVFGLGERPGPLLGEVLAEERGDRNLLAREGATLDAGLEANGGADSGKRVEA